MGATMPGSAATQRRRSTLAFAEVELVELPKEHRKHSWPVSTVDGAHGSEVAVCAIVAGGGFGLTSFAYYADAQGPNRSAAFDAS